MTVTNQNSIKNEGQTGIFNYLPPFLQPNVEYYLKKGHDFCL
jgi:hypothetical protein